jgi:hypothetical protein
MRRGYRVLRDSPRMPSGKGALTTPASVALADQVRTRVQKRGRVLGARC